MTDPSDDSDVVVIGAGNAALCAAIAASNLGRRVVVLEKAPESGRGGNTFLTGGGIRFAYRDPEDVWAVLPDVPEADRSRWDFGSFPPDRLIAKIMDLSHGRADRDLVQYLVTQSLETIHWLHRQGLQFEPNRKHAFLDGTVYRFTKGECLSFKGLGPGLSDCLFEVALAKGIDVRYESAAVGLLGSRSRITGVRLETPSGSKTLGARAVVIASGGFEANADMRKRHLGPGWERAKVRGVTYNTGEGIAMALEVGAEPYGAWDRAQTVAIDANAPLGERERIEKANRHGYCWGIMVNQEGDRFVDEGADFHNFTFSTYGSYIVDQPDQRAFQIFDQQTLHLLREEHYRSGWATVSEAETLEELARKVGIDPDGLARTVEAFNRACPAGTFDPTIKDGLKTIDLDPPKSNWSIPLTQPPFVAYSVAPGVSFTYGGLRVNTRSQVLSDSHEPIPGLYAAGELVGGLFYHDYPSGIGLMSGAVFGATAGTSASEDMA